MDISYAWPQRRKRCARYILLQQMQQASLPARTEVHITKSNNIGVIKVKHGFGMVVHYLHSAFRDNLTIGPCPRNILVCQAVDFVNLLPFLCTNHAINSSYSINYIDTQTIDIRQACQVETEVGPLVTSTSATINEDRQTLLVSRLETLRHGGLSPQLFGVHFHFISAPQVRQNPYRRLTATMIHKYAFPSSSDSSSHWGRNRQETCISARRTRNKITRQLRGGDH